MTERSAALPQSRPKAMVADMATPHIVGKNTKFAGTILYAGRVEVYGTVRGRIRAVEISIKEGGRIDGHVEANSVFNDGLLKGTIRSHRLLLSRRSETGGDIRTVKIGIEPGAQLSEFATIITPDERMIPVQTLESISLEITTGARSSAPAGETCEHASDLSGPAELPGPEAVRQIPYLVSA